MDSSSATGCRSFLPDEMPSGAEARGHLSTKGRQPLGLSELLAPLFAWPIFRSVNEGKLWTDGPLELQ